MIDVLFGKTSPPTDATTVGDLMTPDPVTILADKQTRTRFLTGQFAVKFLDQNGNEIDPGRATVALCRCGRPYSQLRVRSVENCVVTR